MVAQPNRRSIVVGPRLWANLKELSRREEESMSSLIREALQDLFVKRKKERGYDPVQDVIRN